jgi:large subunit ribosomal protein L21
MKKAVITTGGKQYLVSVGEELDVELIKTDKKSVDFDPLLVIDEKNVSIGNPLVKGSSVKVEIIEPVIQKEKVTSIRYKAKKRVRKVRGHRQKQTKIKVKSIN